MDERANEGRNTVPTPETETRPDADVPTVVDRDAPRGRYDEPPSGRARDRVPGRMGGRAEGASPAFVRLRVEQLLLRREAASVEAWEELGDGAEELLLHLLDDESINRREALRQRVIATLGQLGIVRAITRLGEILGDETESALTRAYAASALGHLRDRRAVPALGRAVADRDEMVRRQVALALGRVGAPEAIPYLLALRSDPAAHVAGAAVEGVRAHEEQRGRTLDARTGWGGAA